MFQNPQNERVLDFLWNFITLQMRTTWQRSFQLLSSRHAEIVFLNEPPFFEDITPFVTQLTQLKESNTLENYIQWADLVHRCTVKCPWGCSEFADDVGFVAYHKLLYHYGLETDLKFPLQESTIKALPNMKQVQFAGILSDFLFDRSTCYLDLVSCPILPSIQFVEGIGPMVCTCKRHNGGSELFYLHPPKNPLTKTYSTSVGDPIGQVAIAPRTVTTIKTKNRYNTTYQMQKCNSGFAGKDCCDIKEVGEWDKNNDISRLNAALAYYGRADIRSNIQRMVQSRIIDQSYETTLWLLGQQINLPEREFEDLAHARLRATRIKLRNALVEYYQCS
jgi:hypothetical protein